MCDLYLGNIVETIFELIIWSERWGESNGKRVRG